MIEVDYDREMDSYRMEWKMKLGTDVYEVEAVGEIARGCKPSTRKRNWVEGRLREMFKGLSGKDELPSESFLYQGAGNEYRVTMSISTSLKEASVTSK